MIRVNQVKCPIDASYEQIKIKTAELLHVKTEELLDLTIERQSIDARKKPDVFYTYSVTVRLSNEEKVLKRFRGKENQVSKSTEKPYRFPTGGTLPQKHPVVVVGMGPAGLFCAYYLIRHGIKVIVLERGKAVEERRQDVDRFWKEGILDPESNVQFGEGGAGTFSDGKLNTLVKDPFGRNKEVLRTFVSFGAKPSILYEAKPHIGTDVLSDVVKAMREEILRLGGVVRFGAKLTDIEIVNRQVCSVEVNDRERIPCSDVVLAIGHSARDTFYQLHRIGIPMEAKSFAVGLRVEHKQSAINLSQYGSEDPGELGAAPYKVTAQAKNGRGVYSFCMCPGGYVVNASSEPGRTAVNGMSYSGRDGENANSAIIVSVTPKDFPSDHPLAGIEFQRELEKRAYQCGGGRIPVQTYGDFRRQVTGEPSLQTVELSLQPACKGEYQYCDVSRILPAACNEAFVDGMEQFGHLIAGFDHPETLLSGVESRTSSPVRIHRDETLQSVVSGLYPCGEGAGYAGGITSAAMDGIRVAEQLAQKYRPGERSS
ncbi:MAG: NAD(P)/FAD-dependent oxidoreductase [Acetatifactor sp.]